MGKQSFQQDWQTVIRGYAYHTVNDIGIFTLPALSRIEGISHGFSARTGGVSTGCFSSLNLSFSRPDDPEKIRQNFRLFAEAAGFDDASMVMDNYAHGTVVRQVDAADCGRGWTKDPLPSCDGLITDDPAVTLVTGHADCMAFFCCDPAHRAIGLAHAGWRGALGRIGGNLVDAMVDAFHADPLQMIAGVGPSICQNCFEVGEDVAAQFEQAFAGIPCVRPGKPGKAHVDLWMVAASQFMERGVQPGKFNLMGVCTAEESQRLYSHRRDKGQTGGMAAFLRLI